MIRRLLRQCLSDELTHGQGIGQSPRNSTFRINPFEVPQQQRTKVDSRPDAGAPQAALVVTPAKLHGQYVDPSKEDPKFLKHMHSLYGRECEASSLLRLFSNWSSFRPLDEVRYRTDLPPLHMFWGAKNNVLKLDRGRELCERLGPTTFDVIEGAGHLAMREKPDEVIRRIEQLTQ